MFLRAGLLSLALLLASRILGLVRESAQAAAFGATGMGDVAVLMFTLPDWITSVVAGGALSYALLPMWARQDPGEVAASQRWVARWLLAGGAFAALLLIVAAGPAAGLLAGGLPAALRPLAETGLRWSAGALPLALLAALATSRLQHERDVVGMYAANLVVNTFLITTMLAVALSPLGGLAEPGTLAMAGCGLLVAMAARLAWLHWRLAPHRGQAPAPGRPAIPAPRLWLWAALAAGLPMALPFVARSLASQSGAGALATFNYAWKLVELPLLLAIQLVATLALPTISKAVATGGDDGPQARAAIRGGFALAWVLACAACAGLTLAAPAGARLLFGWGRMQPEAIAEVAAWGRDGAWTLLPQALIAIATAVLAARGRMAPVAVAYAAALGALLAAGSLGLGQGSLLMHAMHGLFWGVAAVSLWALRGHLRAWLPLPALVASAAVLAGTQALRHGTWLDALSTLGQLAVAVAAAGAVVAAGHAASADLRSALRR